MHGAVISSEYILLPVTKEGGPLIVEKPVAFFILLCPLSLCGNVLITCFIPVFWICSNEEVEERRCRSRKKKLKLSSMLYCVDLKNDFRIMIIPQEATNPISFKLKGHFKPKELEDFL